MPLSEQLRRAFDDAEQRVARALAAPMLARDGRPATAQLERLRDALATERAHAEATGAVRAEWARSVVRDVSEWTRDDELALIAALGRIVRVGSGP